MPSSFTKEQKKVLFLSSLGGVLEFYDFIIYIFLAPIIEKIFFADNSSYIATLKTMAIFSIGYLLRPIGGILFSHFGDRYGRKVVFLLTVVFMAVPSFAIGLLPTTTQIGIAAPILLLIFRMMQGLALGGEIPAAITFVSEHVPEKKCGFALATLFFGINIGLLLGSLITTIMSSVLSPQEVLAYGWRIPFLIGGIFGIAAIFLRRYLHETSAFIAMGKNELQRIPVVTLMRNASKQVLKGIFLVSIGSVTVFLFLYWPQYLHQYMNYDFNALMKINTLGTLVLNIAILIGGVLTDRLGSRKLYLIGSSLIILLTYPLFCLFNMQNMTLVIISYVIFSCLFGAIPSTYSVMLTRLFPTPIRYSGIAMSYNLAYAIFGGLSPIICTLAIHWLDNILAPAIYVTGMAMISWTVCYLHGTTINTTEVKIAPISSL